MSNIERYKSCMALFLRQIYMPFHCLPFWFLPDSKSCNTVKAESKSNDDEIKIAIINKGLSSVLRLTDTNMSAYIELVNF